MHSKGEMNKPSWGRKEARGKWQQRKTGPYFSYVVTNKFLDVACQRDAHLRKQILSIHPRRSIRAKLGCKTAPSRASGWPQMLGRVGSFLHKKKKGSV